MIGDWFFLDKTHQWFFIDTITNRIVCEPLARGDYYI